jgi:hypothetical protein
LLLVGKSVERYCHRVVVEPMVAAMHYRDQRESHLLFVRLEEEPAILPLAMDHAR